jgi:hypothetical protein
VVEKVYFSEECSFIDGFRIDSSGAKIKKSPAGAGDFFRK